MKKIFNQISSLQVCTILTTGRTGSDFFQSLLDSHPQVLTFNGHFQFHLFWRNSICVNAGKFTLPDLIDEFIGKHIQKFNSKYDLIEGKDRLGINKNQFIEIDKTIFKEFFLKIMNKQTINSKNCLLGIYGAYALSLNQNLDKKKLFIHHLHRHDELCYFLKDFPKSKIISMTRDPRSNYYSGVNHHKKYNPVSMNGAHHYFYIKRIIDDIEPLKKLGNDYTSIKLEDLGDVRILQIISDWLSIRYNETMLQSTWAGLIWNADRLTTIERKGSGFCKELLNNNWKNQLSRKDKYLLNFLMMDRLKHYGYNYHKRGVFSFFAIPFLIIFPLSHEKQWFKIFDIKILLKPKTLVMNFFYYLKRCLFFYNVYFKVIVGNKFSGKLIKVTHT